jgi:hypothetical protein
MDEPIPEISDLDQKNALALAIVQPGNYVLHMNFCIIPYWKLETRRSG